MSNPLKLNGLTQHNGEEIRFQHYVTLDWDNYPLARMDALKGAIRRHGHIKRAWVRNSTTKGFHVILELDRAYDTWVLFFLRLSLGDDKKRIRWDKKRGDPQGVLFDYKKGLFAGAWVRFK